MGDPNFFLEDSFEESSVALAPKKQVPRQHYSPFSRQSNKKPNVISRQSRVVPTIPRSIRRPIRDDNIDGNLIESYYKPKPDRHKCKKKHHHKHDCQCCCCKKHKDCDNSSTSSSSCSHDKSKDDCSSSSSSSSSESCSDESFSNDDDCCHCDDDKKKKKKKRHHKKPKFGCRGYLFNTDPLTLIACQQKVTFNKKGELCGIDLDKEKHSAIGTITLNNPGIYKIDWSVTFEQESPVLSLVAFGLQVDNTIVKESVQASATLNITDTLERTIHLVVKQPNTNVSLVLASNSTVQLPERTADCTGQRIPNATLSIHQIGAVKDCKPVCDCKESICPRKKFICNDIELDHSIEEMLESLDI